MTRIYYTIQCVCVTLCEVQSGYENRKKEHNTDLTSLSSTLLDSRRWPTNFATNIGKRMTSCFILVESIMALLADLEISKKAHYVLKISSLKDGHFVSSGQAFKHCIENSVFLFTASHAATQQAHKNVLHWFWNVSIRSSKFLFLRLPNQKCLGIA